MNGKRGDGAGDMVMVLWLFLLLALVAGGVALSVGIYYTDGYDVRAAEAQALYDHLASCISATAPTWESREAFFAACGLQGDVFENGESKLGILVCEGSCAAGKRVIQIGSDFESCAFTGKNEAYARCAQGNVSEGSREYEIIVMSNHRATGGSA